MKIYYVVDVRECDASHIPISMFDQPALWTCEKKAEKFATFARSTGRTFEVRCIDMIPEEERVLTN